MAALTGIFTTASSRKRYVKTIMTSIPARINNRKIVYLDIVDDLREFNALPLNKWILFVIEDDIMNPVLPFFASLCIEKDVVYVCSAGKACSEMDDLFDMEMVNREMEGKYIPEWIQNDDDVLMTTWHEDFDEGFCFATTVAGYNDIPITDVVVVNLTKQKYLRKIEELTQRINEGWAPSY